MKLNKTLHPSDYDHLQPQLTLFNDVTSKIDAIIHHKHRRWEYGVALAALDLIRSNTPVKSILDIGGGGSPLPAMVASMGYSVTVVDPSGDVKRQADYAKTLGLSNLSFEHHDLDGAVRALPDADVVFCVSTLEHIQDDVEAFKTALRVAKYLAVFTVDYHTTGQAQSPHHLRTYNRASLENLVALAAPDWVTVDSPSWEDHGAQVYNYNFAALVLRRQVTETEMLLSSMAMQPSEGNLGVLIPEEQQTAMYKAVNPDADTVPYEVNDKDDTQPEKPKRKRARK